MSSNGFNPNAPALPGAGIFGLPSNPEQDQVVCIPVPWDATTSYRSGTAGGPTAILNASKQVDLFDLDVDRPYQAGIHLLPISEELTRQNQSARRLALPIIEAGGEIGGDPALAAALTQVNDLCNGMNRWVEAKVSELLAQNKIPILVGGDHSTPFGAIAAASQAFPGIGLLQIDAHLDLRLAYEGFTWSHASITRNVADRLPGVSRIIQVGIRDFCQDELEFAESTQGKIVIHFDTDLSRRRLEGGNWKETVDTILAALPEQVWITFDIDGLDPSLCPHTGTPVPGGLSYQEAIYLISSVAQSGRRIIGCDLNEVYPGAQSETEWDANVGARVLYQMIAWSLVSQGRCRQRSR